MREPAPQPPHPRRPRARVAHTTQGRLRIRVDTPRGQGKLHRMATELERMPGTGTVRTNHAARSVTVTYDPRQVSASALLERLHSLGEIALDLANPEEWGELLAEEVVPRAGDPDTLAGRVNRDLLAISGGAIDLFRVAVGLLLFSAGMQIRGALLRAEPIPWMRVATYLLAAASIWSRPRTGGARPAAGTAPE